MRELGEKRCRLTTLHRCQDRRHTGKFGIKITRVLLVLDSRLERWRYPLLIHILPIHPPEEGMTHDFLRVCRSGAESMCWFTSEQLLQNGNGVAWHMDRVEWFVGQDGVVDFILIFTAEGGLLEKHLIDQHAECPPVDSAAVFLVQENLLQNVS